MALEPPGYLHPFGTVDIVQKSHSQAPFWIYKALFFNGKICVPLGGYPSSCSQNMGPPYCPIQALYNPYIRWYMLVHISRILSQEYPTFPFDCK